MRNPVALLLPVLLVLTSSIGYRQQANAFSAQAPKQNQNSAMTPPPSETATEAGRRAFLRTAGATIAATCTTSSVLISAPSPAVAATSTEVQLETLEDAGNGFSIKVPKSWTASTQSLPDRRKMKLYIDPSTSEKDDKTLLFLAYTPVRDDFTSLGSFGSVEEVAQATILPKGEMMGEGTTSKLLSAESKKNAYFFDYTAKVPGQPERHFRTIFTLAQGATGGAGANLVTITAQSPESRYSDVKSTFDAIIDSYGKFTGN